MDLNCKPAEGVTTVARPRGRAMTVAIYLSASSALTMPSSVDASIFAAPGSGSRLANASVPFRPNDTCSCFAPSSYLRVTATSGDSRPVAADLSTNAVARALVSAVRRASTFAASTSLAGLTCFQTSLAGSVPLAGVLDFCTPLSAHRVRFRLSSC